MLNGCGECENNHVWKYDGIVHYDQCVANSDTNCLIGDENKCI